MTHTDYTILLGLLAAAIATLGTVFVIGWLEQWKTPSPLPPRPIDLLDLDSRRLADPLASLPPLKAAELEFARVWQEHRRCGEEKRWVESAARDGDLVAFERWKELERNYSLTEMRLNELEKDLKIMRLEKRLEGQG